METAVPPRDTPAVPGLAPPAVPTTGEARAHSRILLIAQGEYIAAFGRQLQEEIEEPEDLAITVAHMEDAVPVARHYVQGGTEVIIARATSSTLLSQAGLPATVVPLPISNEEIFASVTRARSLVPDGARIGFLGFTNEVSSLVAILRRLDYNITLYEVASTKQNHDQLARAQRDRVPVLICGERSADLVRLAGIQPVVIESSLDSLRQAYRQAKNIVQARAIEKKNIQETVTMFDSVSDAVVSLDPDGRITMINRLGTTILGLPEGDGPVLAKTLFTAGEWDEIEQVRETGEERLGGILERRGVQYAMRIVPVVVGRTVSGMVVTLQEIRALQRMERTVRQGLFQKGNVARYVFDDIKGDSAAIRAATAAARSFAGLQSNVLILGETGTGKELFAQSIHTASLRRDRPFVAVNCGAIPGNLIESELFGYADGAFTGSKKGGRIGLFELAHSGTIFLDEISEMDPSGQISLLRALQERQIRRVGGDGVIPVDVRVIAACNADLDAMVRDGRFRRDLYYRLGVLVLRVPPLRGRREDVVPLAKHFLAHYNRCFG
ncbi:MAG: sigma 54-interacting transcriptional regulator, partial [Planctomycetes bacterium]|nr:sigma 54-interacting transcriptional regulator [Planctomycetota bacterium]